MALKAERGPTFFDLLAKQGENLVAASELLHDLLSAEGEDRVVVRDNLHDIEHEADELNHLFISKIKTKTRLPMLQGIPNIV